MLCPDSLPHWPLCKCRRLLSSHISATHSSGNYLANRCFKNTGTGKISSGKWVISGMFIHPSLETPKVVFGAGGKGATRDGLCFTRCYLLYLQVLLLYIQVLLIYLQVLLHIQVLPTLPPSTSTLHPSATYFTSKCYYFTFERHLLYHLQSYVRCSSKLQRECWHIHVEAAQQGD